jgi:hypothetical protein
MVCNKYKFRRIDRVLNELLGEKNLFLKKQKSFSVIHKGL